MIPDLYTTIFTELGLSITDGQVYFGLLQHQNLSLTELAKLVQISRVTLYDSFKCLEKAGMVSKYGSKYLPQSPRKLSGMLDQKRETIAKLDETFSTFIPELMGSYYQNKPKPAVQFFEGKIQYRLVADQILDSHPNEILLVGNDREFAELIGWEYFDRWITRRVTMKIPFKALAFPYPEYEGLYKMRENAELREVKWLPSNLQKSGSFIISGETISIWNPIQARVILIHDPVAAALAKTMFEIYWSKVVQS